MNPDKVWRAALILAIGAAVSCLVWSLASAEPELQANACFNSPTTADPTATVCISNVNVLFNGTGTDNQFYVSWRTLASADGHVKLVGGDTYYDVRGANYQGVTHYVRVNNLAAKTNYLFDVLTNGQTYTNGGAHWTARLGPALAAPTPYFVFGRVKNPDTSDADGALVYAQVRDGDSQGTQGRSGLLSAVIVLADGGDFFNINLSTARTQNNADLYLFNPAGDRVLVVAQGEQGSASKAFPVGDLHPPKPPPSLILGTNGSGNVVTATPTVLPPTETPTASPTATETEMPVPTLTEVPALPTEIAEPIETETAAVPPTFETVPTLSPEQATRLADETNATQVAEAANQPQPDRTRVFGGVPLIQPPAQASPNTWLLLGLAAVLIVGAALLGLAALFVSRR